MRRGSRFARFLFFCIGPSLQRALLKKCASFCRSDVTQRWARLVTSSPGGDGQLSGDTDNGDKGCGQLANGVVQRKNRYSRNDVKFTVTIVLLMGCNQLLCCCF